ncbi:MAG: flagellar type III secretion system pore protein FliP [Planctomycetes bacterium]|nr:flagellar type III secretion system pore protein FliP [Planctomycetota bacterium]MCB9872009.1 flagellar type III secretion system pore protein FliP [Planctomycetota bacterium]MCB9888413.1 flagellar type III secretion system pore protein FliP [Planctomycetota bacterium]
MRVERPPRRVATLRPLLRILLVVLAALLVNHTASAQQGAPNSANDAAPAGSGATAAKPGSDPQDRATLTLSLPGSKRESLGNAIEIVLLMTVLSLAPAIVLTMTCFTRIIIVLSFLRRAMSMQDLPPTTVVTGFAVFMSAFIMRPVIQDIKADAYDPYVAGKIGFEKAAELASNRMKKFMGKQTRRQDIALIQSLASNKPLSQPTEAPLHVMVPAFILSEIKTAFQMGFVLFLPFVIIDLVISSILVSMGMFTLPPVVISTPLKILLFVLVDGWNLVISSLASSFATNT